MDGIKAIIWDLDGTLLDTLDDLAAAVNAALREYGLPTRTRDEVRQFVGNGMRLLIRRAVPAGSDKATEEQVFRAFRAYYDTHSRVFTAPYPGIPEALERLAAAGIRMAVVSNKAESSVEDLRRAFFADTVTVAAGDRPDRPRKPAPDGTLAAIAALGVSPREAVFVGDSDVDIETARAAGLPCLSVTWGFRSETFLREHGAATLIATPQELAEKILE